MKLLLTLRQSFRWGVLLHDSVGAAEHCQCSGPVGGGTRSGCSHHNISLHCSTYSCDWQSFADDCQEALDEC
jgi:hypothetical protein